MRLLAGDQIPAVVAACTCPTTTSTGHILFFAVIPPYVPHLSTLVRLAGFRLIEAGLPENLDVDCQPSLSMRCVASWKLSGPPSLQVSSTCYNWRVRRAPP